MAARSISWSSTGGGLLAVEVKASSRPGYNDWRHLRRFVDDYRDSCVGALLMHDGDDITRLDDKVLGVPWWRVI